MNTCNLLAININGTLKENMKTPKQWNRSLPGRLSEQTIETIQIDAINSEQARWQNEIYQQLRLACPKANIDGKGCDSGDPLDFTISEIWQALAHLSDERDALKEALKNAQHPL